MDNFDTLARYWKEWLDGFTSATGCHVENMEIMEAKGLVNDLFRTNASFDETFKQGFIFGSKLIEEDQYEPY